MSNKNVPHMILQEEPDDNSTSSAPAVKMDRSESEVAREERREELLARGVLPEAIEIEEGDKKRRKIVFIFICVLQLFANFDGGVVPAALKNIRQEFTLDYIQSGMLGSLVYVGLVISCPITGVALVKIKSQRKVLLGGLFFNILAMVLFLTVSSSSWLLFARFLTGLSQGALFVYPPVWVDEFAPEDSMTTWIGTLQSMVAVAVMVGYLVTAVSMALGGGWRVAMWIQVFVMMFFFFRFLLLRGRLFNARGGEEARMLSRSQKILIKRKKTLEIGVEEDAGDDEINRASDASQTLHDMDDLNEPQASACSMLLVLIKNPVYMCLVGALCGLYFVVTGVSFCCLVVSLSPLNLPHLPCFASTV